MSLKVRNSKTSVKVAVVLAVLALASLLFASWSAQAHVRGYRTRVSIQFSRRTDTLSGVVRSNIDVGNPRQRRNRDCNSGREVSVYFQLSGPDRLVAMVLSERRGRWGPVPATGAGYYYAVAAQRELPGYVDGYDPGHDHRCMAGESNTIRVR
ncbi:MAG: hypothetical protein ACRDIF_04965 [Actinomycetota bacterium]